MLGIQVLDQCRSCIDFSVFLQHLESGLQDHYDVKMPCHSMLIKLASISPHTLLMSLERFVDPLEKTLTVGCVATILPQLLQQTCQLYEPPSCVFLPLSFQVKLKSDAVKQEVDRNDDMLRSCLRAIDALTQIPSVESCTPFMTFMNK